MSSDVDRDGLETALRAAVRGEVKFDVGSRGAYSTDASNFRQVPLGVVCPRDVDDLVAVHAVCREYAAPVLLRGGGTSLAGQTTNTAMVVDTSRHLHRLLALDPQARTAEVEPGVLNADLRAAAERHGLTFGPDPATKDRCTIGGNIGNNSCGAHSVAWGKTSENVESLEVLLYDGTRLTLGPTDAETFDTLAAAPGRVGAVHRALLGVRDRHLAAIRTGYPPLPRRVSGYALDALLPENGANLARLVVGSEGTLATVLRATVRLHPAPRHRRVVAMGFPDVFTAADRSAELLAHRPLALEGFEERLIAGLRASGISADDLGRLPEGAAYLFAELPGDTPQEAAARAEALGAASGGTYRLYDDVGLERRVWTLREVALAAAARTPGRPVTWPGWEDSAVPPERLGDYLRRLEELLREYGYEDVPYYGHFGDGCVHTRIPFELSTDEGVAAYQRFLEDAADLVVAHGGSLSGEHGDGQQRAHLLERMYGPELVRAFGEVKAAFDPDGRMNPGKLVDPVRVLGPAEHLRVGPSYRPMPVTTQFRFPDDAGGFAGAVGRCVGVGKCRVPKPGHGQVMCPSYQVLREERHSTRGRARLLFEMLDGSVVTDGWRSTAVHEALDMCLSCKGCRSDCPTGVDMATYKAEFLAHHYRRRLRPVTAYSMGLIGRTAPWAARVPRLANALLRGPAAGLVKRLGGIAPQRTAPAFAEQTFAQWFAGRPVVNAGGPPVMLLADTFSAHFHLDVAIATCEVLEDTGHRVVLPSRRLCCGRPLFDQGFLGEARRGFLRALDTLREAVVAGTPVVVPDPSCAAAYRDELVALLPDDPRAQALARLVMTLPEFLDRQAADWRPPQVGGVALVQTHCHEHAVLDPGAERRVLERAGVEVRPSGAGCCGLAGSWGFEREKYPTSMAIGEQALFPAVRERGPGTVVVADGFSCRTQVADGTGVEAVHLAQLLRRRPSPGH